MTPQVHVSAPDPQTGERHPEPTHAFHDGRGVCPHCEPWRYSVAGAKHRSDYRVERAA